MIINNVKLDVDLTKKETISRFKKGFSDVALKSEILENDYKNKLISKKELEKKQRKLVEKFLIKVFPKDVKKILKSLTNTDDYINAFKDCVVQYQRLAVFAKILTNKKGDKK